MAKPKFPIDEAKLEMKTPPFVVSYPHLFKPAAMPGTTKEMYSIEMLFDKKTTKITDFQAAAHAACVAEWGPDKTLWPEGLKFPFRDGDKPFGKKKEVRPEHAGRWVIKASSNAEFSRPTVVDQRNQPLHNEADVYPGCIAEASVKAMAWSFADKDGVKFLLNGVRFVRDGEPLGGRKSAAAMFGDVVEDVDGNLDNEDSLGF